MCLDWRNDKDILLADCDIVVNGGRKRYSIHLEVACCLSRFFFCVATQKTVDLQSSSLESLLQYDQGSIQIMMKDGTNMWIGNISDTVTDLRKRIRRARGIHEDQQRILYRKSREVVLELDEEWRSLASYGVRPGDSILLLTQQPWQRTEASGDKRTVHLTLPDHCVDAFEGILDYMYGFHRELLHAPALPDLTAEAALATLWLAGRLEMRGLEQQLADHLRDAVTVRTAHLYLPAAVRLGSAAVRDAATRLAAAGPACSVTRVSPVPPRLLHEAAGPACSMTRGAGRQGGGRAGGVAAGHGAAALPLCRAGAGRETRATGT